MKTHGPHPSVTRQHCFSCEEDSKGVFPQSSHSNSFVSSKSSRLSEKFAKLSVVTTCKFMDSVDHSMDLDTEGFSKGDHDCPENESEEWEKTSKGKSVGGTQEYEVVFQGMGMIIIGICF